MEMLLLLLGLAVLSAPILLIVALASIGGLKRRVAELETQLAALRSPGAAAAQVQRQAPLQASPVPPPPSVSSPPTPAPLAGPAPSVSTPPSGSGAAPASSRRPEAGAVPRSDAGAPRPPDRVTLAVRAVKRWFTVGNVPVKVGMLVLLAGVAALLKYASDQGWLTLPVELRLAAVATAALAGLVLGWRKRDSHRGFALSLQGGMIGILLLVVFAAFKRYGLVPAPAAFALSIALVAGAAVLAVLQNAKALAVLAILAGFLAPLWLSTGGGSHVALFSYYAVLNAGVLAIAWRRPWRILNLLGFAFTFGVGTLWGVLQYRPEQFASTQPFLALFFAFYLLVPLLYARRRPAGRRDAIDGCLVFGTPLVAFSLQAGLLDGARMPLAFCALGLAALYALLAWTLLRRPHYAALARAHAVLAVGFATLAVPLALSAAATACVFAVEGAALAWLGLQQRRLLPQLSGLGLQLAAAAAFVVGGQPWREAAVAVANPAFMGALLIALGGFASAWSYRRGGRARPALAYYLWGLCWWTGGAVRELAQFLPGEVRLADALLAFAALTGWLAAEVHRRLPAAALALTTLAGLLLAMPLALAQTLAGGHPFAGYGGAAWAAFAVLGLRSLACLRRVDDRHAERAQFAWWLVWPLVAALLLLWLADRAGLGQGWHAAAVGLPWLAALLVSMLRWRWLTVPVGERFDRCRPALQTAWYALLGLWWWGALCLHGAAAPLPWLPLLNPLELAQLAVLAAAARWLWSGQAPAWLARLRIPQLALGGFAWISFATLRSVHHWGGVPWSAGLLSSSLAQTGLTVVWSVLGVAGWIVGSRRGGRGLWLAGAVLMGVVLAKLMLVDRDHLGNLWGIGSFIAYGLLCTLVGYFAPAPPRAGTEEARA